VYGIISQLNTSLNNMICRAHIWPTGILEQPPKYKTSYLLSGLKNSLIEHCLVPYQRWSTRSTITGTLLLIHFPRPLGPICVHYIAESRAAMSPSSPSITMDALSRSPCTILLCSTHTSRILSTLVRESSWLRFAERMSYRSTVGLLTYFPMSFIVSDERHLVSNVYSKQWIRSSTTW